MQMSAGDLLRKRGISQSRRSLNEANPQSCRGSASFVCASRGKRAAFFLIVHICRPIKRARARARTFLLQFFFPLLLFLTRLGKRNEGAGISSLFPPPSLRRLAIRVWINKRWFPSGRNQRSVEKILAEFMIIYLVTGIAATESVENIPFMPIAIEQIDCLIKRSVISIQWWTNGKSRTEFFN